MDNYVGEIRSFAGDRIPEGWHLCDGSELMISDHMVLFALIGFIYGGSDASGKFRLPDLRSRIPLGVGGNYSLGKPGGAEKVGLSTDHLPGHRHPVACSTSGKADLPGAVDGVWSASDGKGALYTSEPGTTGMNTESIQAEGAGQEHENRVPVMAVSFMIALVGLFPSES